MLRIQVIIRTVIAILKGKAIIIEDLDEKSCKTFVGSQISHERFRVLILNQVNQIRTNLGGI